jgi:hypothetical protein
MQMLPKFESKIILRLPMNKQCDGPMLFLLMGQCFQEVGLTKWTNVVSACCPDKDAKTFNNLVECQQDYLETLAPNIDDQLICWFHTDQKPVLMPMHDYIRCQVQLFRNREKGLLHKMMELPTKQEKIKQIFFVPKKHQQKYAKMHKNLPDDPIPLVSFFEQCQSADQANDVLDQLQKEEKDKALKIEHQESLQTCPEMQHHKRYRAQSYNRSDYWDYHCHHNRHDCHDQNGRYECSGQV